MSNSTSKFVMSKPIKATLNGEVVNVFYQKPLSGRSGEIERAIAAASRSTKKLEFGICRWVESGSDAYGAQVVRIPEGHTGVSDEYNDDNLEAVGTLLQRDGKWYVETDLNAVEILRRAKEAEDMKAGRRWIGEFGHDYGAYAKTLSERDKKEGRLITRGHGLD